MKDSFSQMRSFMAKKAPQKLSVEDLKKESEVLFVKKQAEEDKLVELYNAKKLTNKNTIRKARNIVNQRKAAETQKNN